MRQPEAAGTASTFFRAGFRAPFPFAPLLVGFAFFAIFFLAMGSLDLRPSAGRAAIP
jgi:hypothetical protein